MQLGIPLRAVQHEQSGVLVREAPAPRWIPIAVAACVVLAFALRVHGIGFGLPELYYWDEPTIVNRAMRFGSGDFNPHFFFYPALYMYVVFAASGVYFVAGKLCGHFHGVDDFATEYFTDPSGVYLAARLTTALIGAAAVLVAYRVGARFFGRKTGLLGALFLAVSVLHGTYSHVAITDVPHALWILAACLPLHAILRRSKTRDYAIAGALIGFGIATKYLAVMLVPSLVLAHVLRDERWIHGRPSLRALMRDLASRELVLAALATAAAFFIGSPFNFLELRAFLADSNNLAAGQGDTSSASVSSLLLCVLPGDFGWPVCLLAAFGFASIVWRHARSDVVFVCFPIVYFVAIARFSHVPSRYMIPESAFVALFAAHAAITLWHRVAVRVRVRAVARGAFAIVLLASIAPSAIALVTWDRWMATVPDTRTRAREWVEVNIPSVGVVAVQDLYGRTFWTVPLSTEDRLAKLSRDIPDAARFQAVRERVFASMRQRPLYKSVEWRQDLRALEREGVGYVIVSDANGALEPAFEADLVAHARATWRFAPDPDRLRWIPHELPDIVAVLPPTITVYGVR